MRWGAHGAGLAVALLAGVASAAVGCNLIVGAGDYSVGAAGSSSDDSGAVPDGGGDSGEPDGGKSPAGSIGDPCGTTLPCTQGSCMAGIPWCTTTCTASGTTCGSASSGEANFCIENASNQFICFPGCTTSGDCSAYAGTTCQPVSAGTGSICSAPPGGFIGDPCSVPSDCTEGTCETGILWCTSSCTVDSDCLGIDSAGQPTFCVENGASQFICFPGCTTNADCSAFPGLTCKPITTEPGSICSQ